MVEQFLKTRIAMHLAELQKAGVGFPENWHWHPEKVEALEQLDAQLLADVVVLHERPGIERAAASLRALHAELVAATHEQDYYVDTQHKVQLHVQRLINEIAHALNMTLHGVVPIPEMRNDLPRSREGLKLLVERPLLRACEILYDKNILTLSSSANGINNSRAEALPNIIIDWDSLSEENKRTARQVGEFLEDYDGFPVVVLTFPATPQTTSRDIETASVDIAQRFMRQPPVWIQGESVRDYVVSYIGSEESARECFGDLSPDTLLKAAKEMIEGTPRYLDPESGLIYPSEELYMKAKAFK